MFGGGGGKARGRTTLGLRRESAPTFPPSPLTVAAAADPPAAATFVGDVCCDAGAGAEEFGVPAVAGGMGGAWAGSGKKPGKAAAGLAAAAAAGVLPAVVSVKEEECRAWVSQAPRSEEGVAEEGPEPGAAGSAAEVACDPAVCGASCALLQPRSSGLTSRLSSVSD